MSRRSSSLQAQISSAWESMHRTARRLSSASALSTSAASPLLLSAVADSRNAQGRSARSRTRRLISSIVARNASSPLPVGSSSPAVLARCAQGSIGHWTPQPIVTTTSTGGSSSSALGQSLAVLDSRHAAKEPQRVGVHGVGGVRARRRTPRTCPRRLSGRVPRRYWLRHELCVHTNATRGLRSVTLPSAVPMAPPSSPLCQQIDKRRC